MARLRKQLRARLKIKASSLTVSSHIFEVISFYYESIISQGLVEASKIDSSVHGSFTASVCVRWPERFGWGCTALRS